jgi:hypothetical protein
MVQMMRHVLSDFLKDAAVLSAKAAWMAAALGSSSRDVV